MDSVKVQFDVTYVAEVRIKTGYTICKTLGYPWGKGPNGEEVKLQRQISRIKKYAEKHHGEILKLYAMDGDTEVITHILFMRKEEVKAFIAEVSR